MMWQIEENNVSPTYRKALYFFYLPHDGEVVYDDEPVGNMHPQRYCGGLESFYRNNLGAPLIPIDFHLAMTLGWVDEPTMARNMPYLSDKVRAAIALVA